MGEERFGPASAMRSGNISHHRAVDYKMGDLALSVVTNRKGLQCYHFVK